MSEESNTPKTPNVSLATLILGGMFLALPPVIPFYFAVKTEDPTLFWIFIATGLSMAVGNALMLALIRRWIDRMMEP